MDQIIMEQDRKTFIRWSQSWSHKLLDAWSQSWGLKFELQLHSPVHSSVWWCTTYIIIFVYNISSHGCVRFALTSEVSLSEVLVDKTTLNAYMW